MRQSADVDQPEHATLSRPILVTCEVRDPIFTLPALLPPRRRYATPESFREPGVSVHRPARRLAPRAARLAFGALVLACLVATAGGEELAGRVTDVLSGDTLRLDPGAGSVEVRLSDIGAPQGPDYYAPASRQLLANITAGSVVRVAITGRSAPDRVFGRVRVGELDVNLELVKRGAAWVCLEYATDTNLLPYERTAQRLQLGLWGGTWTIDAWAACRARPPAPVPATAR